jgi:hypothetical protein
MIQDLTVKHGRCHICTLKPPCKHMEAPATIEVLRLDMQDMDPVNENEGQSDEEAGYDSGVI